MASTPLDAAMVYPVMAMRVLSETNATGSGNASSSSAATAAKVVPFGSSDVLDDTLLHVLGFLIVLVAAHPLGMLFPRFMKLPLITGYLIVGILTGPFLANLLTTQTVAMLASSINAMALSFISFQAGQEIYLPELKPQIKGILQLLTVLYFTAMILLTAIMTLGAGPFFYGSFDSACKLAIALLFGSIAVLGSPATVMAIKIELNSVGPFTNLMLGATMTAEFVVLISFSIARVISSVYCAKLDISMGNLMFTMGIVFSNVLVGAIIGLLIIAIFLIPGGPDHHHDHHDHTATNRMDDEDDVAVLSSSAPKHHSGSPQASGCGALIGSLYFKGFLWLFMGYIFYISTNVISEITIASFGHVWDVKFEPLLVLMVGSCLAGHHSKIRHDMHVILDASAPFVFLPFFVMTGAALKLDQVANAIPLMSLFVGLRYAAIFLACYGAGRWILKLPPQQYNNLWLTMTPQAGVALGLANEIKSLSKDPWASEFAATIVAAVVVNQIIGPVLCALGLSRAGESGGGAQKKVDSSPHPDDHEMELEAGFSRPPDPGLGGGMNEPLITVRRAVVIGEDQVACELALQLALHGADVAMPMLDDAKAERWDKMKDHIRSANQRGENANIGDFRQLGAAPASNVQRGNADMTSARSRAAMAEKPADLILFTGNEQRVLDHVRLLDTMGSQGRKPRLVAILDVPAMLDQLRSRGVVCVQSSLALSNIGMRIALMDDSSSAQLVATESVPTAEKHWLNGGLAAPAAGSSNADLQRVLLHRRRVLQRNIQSTRALQSFLSPHQPTGNMAPQRVSMFGRSSVVDFGIGARAASTRGGNFVVANDVYIMGGGANGEGGYEDGPLDETDELYLNSARSGRGYVAGASPAAQGKRGGNSNSINKFLAKNGGAKNMTGSRGNHRAHPPRNDWS